MLSSSKDGTYRMCLARRKCDRLQKDKNCTPFIHFVCIVLIILTATYPITLRKNKGTYATSVVSLPFNKTYIFFILYIYDTKVVSIEDVC